MEFFKFKGITLEEAFRKFCVQLHLTGETQAVDRILFQLSLHFWNCNIDTQTTYRTIGFQITYVLDIVYGILFSIVLLNTDLNTVNIGIKSHKKMTLKNFMTNTLCLLEGLLKKEKQPLEIEQIMDWRHDMEIILKEIYASVKELPIKQHNPEKIPLITNLNKTSTPWVSTSSRFGFLKRGKSASTLVEGIPDAKTVTTPTSQVVIEGILIRKHLLADDGEKASSRRWTKFWCAIVKKDNGSVELLVHKLTYHENEYSNAEQDTPVQYSENDKYPSPDTSERLPSIDQSARSTLSNVIKHFTSSPDSSIPINPIFSSPAHDYKFSNQEPEIFSLAHSFASTHHHGPQRENCFSFHLANNHVYLFHAPTTEAGCSWIQTINHWAARRSKEPMRGSIGNVDYGWGTLKNFLVEVDDRSGYSPPEEGDHPPVRDLLTRSKGLKTIRFVKWTGVSISSRLLSVKDDVISKLMQGGSVEGHAETNE